MTGLITEKGVCEASEQGLKELFKWKKCLQFLKKKNALKEVSQ